MVSTLNEDNEGLIYNIKISSVGPGRASGQNIVHEPSNMDLAMKLHYIKGVYYFSSKAFEGLSSIKQIKEPTFNWLNHFFITSGRLRRSEETGRPYIKCNDCGTRLIEAQCVKRLDEWFEMKDDISALEKLLVYSQCIGPDLSFSPLIYMQFTRFKCGGVSMGFSMAHVLGDAFSASEYFHFLGKVMSGHKLSIPINIPQSLANEPNIISSPKNVEDHLASVKKVGPVGDNWMVVNDSKMEAFSFHVTPSNLSQMQSKLSDKDGDTFPTFESLCAVLWQHIVKIRQGDEPNVVTIIQKGSKDNATRVVGNYQVISYVKAEFAIRDDQESRVKLATMIKNCISDERKKIEDAMEREEGLSDLCVYGANLTFVNYEDADFYGCEIIGEKPVKVSYWVDGVGDNGAVFVLPGPYDASTQGSYGRIVTVILPKEEAMELILELKREWSIV